MNIKEISKLAQSCFQDRPTIILGSGAAMPHGLPSMEALSTYLRDNLQIDGKVETKAWAVVSGMARLLARSDVLILVCEASRLLTALRRVYPL